MQFSLQLSVAHRNSGTATRYKDISQCLTLKIYSNPFFVAGNFQQFCRHIFFCSTFYVSMLLLVWILKALSFFVVRILFHCVEHTAYFYPFNVHFCPHYKQWDVHNDYVNAKKRRNKTVGVEPRKID